MQIRQTQADLHALLAPHRGMIDGRAALESFGGDEIAAALALFLDLQERHRDDAMVHVGLANAYALSFEKTRADRNPDVGGLRLASVHAHEACCLDIDYGEAWATLGFVLERIGDRANALAALRKAVALEPNNRHHWLRLAYCSWGEERLRAAYRTLALMPDCPMAHWLAATVFVARGALAQAEREVDAGLAALRTSSISPPKRRIVALHWLKGLLCLERGEVDEAMAALNGELALEAQGHFYARECCAQAWAAIGAVRLRRDDRQSARVAFNEAIARVPLLPLAHAGMAIASAASGTATQRITGAPSSVDEAIGRAALCVAAGNASAAVQLVMDALAVAPPGSAGWRLALEPLLDVRRDPDAWAPVLTLLRARAS